MGYQLFTFPVRLLTALDYSSSTIDSLTADETLLLINEGSDTLTDILLPFLVAVTPLVVSLAVVFLGFRLVKNYIM